MDPMNLSPLYWLGPVGAISALGAAFAFSRGVMANSEGEGEMVEIAQAVRDGAMAYLTRQYKVVAIVCWALGVARHGHGAQRQFAFRGLIVDVLAHSIFSIVVRVRAERTGGERTCTDAATRETGGSHR